MAGSPLATPGATRAVLDKHSLTTRKSLGQHFLVDDNVVRRIMALAEISPDDVVLEVGPGIGTLTLALCGEAGSVVAVERDDALLPVLAETTAACPKVSVVHADAVKVSAEQIAAAFGPPGMLVANLPYAVAATVVLRFFEILPSLQSAVVMVQAEVAERMAASPGTKAYGAYTVKLRLHARPAARFAVARTCFLPPPRVDSTMIRLERDPLTADAASIANASAAATAAFAQRRKTLRNSMRSALGIDGSLLDAALAEAGIEGGVRAETLEPRSFLAIGDALSRQGVLSAIRP